MDRGLRHLVALLTATHDGPLVIRAGKNDTAAEAWAG